jgi:hypothetical protein
VIVFFVGDQFGVGGSFQPPSRPLAAASAERSRIAFEVGWMM